MLRTNIINFLIQKINAKKYLEIGVSDGVNFSNIKCEYKVGVDPELQSPATIHLTSDDFFKNNNENFDVIFIDGLHHSDQVYRDIINSLEILNDGGYIICHDMNPQQEEHQIIPFTGGIWNGDCWKAFVQLRKERDDLDMFVVDTDHGCGVISRGKQEILLDDKELSWNNFLNHRKEWLNLISTSDFLQKINHICVYDTNNIDDLLINYTNDPENPETNFKLAIFYNNIGQTAAAVSYYLRAAERYEEDILKYECLILSSLCFDSQGTRNFTVKGLLLNALALCPNRPEAYYLMSKFYEKQTIDGNWNESYAIASIGLKVSDPNSPPLRIGGYYLGEYTLIFQKAVSGWFCGLCEESKDLLLNLLDKYEMNSEFYQLTMNNLKNMNVEIEKFSSYKKSKYNDLKIKFNGSENIEQNYSEAYQDMFVLTMLNGKRNGTYLEIGAGNAFYGNNTALLEKDFGWKGVALDIDENFVNAHNQERSNTCLLKDATLINYPNFLSGLDFPHNIDYLQLDCDPPEVTYKILLSIPFDSYKFAVITYEHDHYCDETKSFQEKSRKYLESYGYVRVVNNISPDDFRPYEDWWIHPDLVDSEMLNKMSCVDGTTKKAERYMLNDKKNCV